MTFFVDTANLDDIKAAFERGIVSGVTTNPSLLAKEPKGKFEEHIGTIVDFLKNVWRADVKFPHLGRYPHLSVEVFSRDADEIVRQAEHFRKTFQYENLSIKVQIGYDELKTIQMLAKRGFSVNCTCCMDVNQALLGASAGAKFVSLFWGRIRDTENFCAKQAEVLSEEDFSVWEEKWFGKSGILDGDDLEPSGVVAMTRFLLDRDFPDVQIIVGSIRAATDIRDAALSGAHIVTVPPKFFSQMASHFKTDEVVAQFLTDFDEWMK